MKLRFFPEGYSSEGCYRLFQVFGATFVTIGGLTYLVCGDLGGMNRNPCLFCGEPGGCGRGAVIAGNGIVRGIIHCPRCGTLLTVRFDDASFAEVVEELKIDQRVAKCPWEGEDDVLVC
jgi:hypothetical protein